jgi:hypothetical protein
MLAPAICSNDCTLQRASIAANLQAAASLRTGKAMSSRAAPCPGYDGCDGATRGVVTGGTVMRSAIVSSIGIRTGVAPTCTELTSRHQAQDPLAQGPLCARTGSEQLELQTHKHCTAQRCSSSRRGHTGAAQRMRGSQRRMRTGDEHTTGTHLGVHAQSGPAHLAWLSVSDANRFNNSRGSSTCNISICAVQSCNHAELSRQRLAQCAATSDAARCETPRALYGHAQATVCLMIHERSWSADKRCALSW